MAHAVAQEDFCGLHGEESFGGIDAGIDKPHDRIAFSR
jgi:hypothetical protein